MKAFSDELLMDKVKGGNLKYLEDLFDRYQRKLYNYFVKCTQDWEEGNDLTQQTFVRVMKYRTSYQTGKSFEIWLFQIARNLVRDHFRKMKVHNDQFDFVEEIPDRIEEVNDDQLEKEQVLYQALALMDPDKRELLVMAKMQGMKYEDIAQIREVSVGATKVQVHRAVAKLRDIYKDLEAKQQ